MCAGKNCTPVTASSTARKLLANTGNISRFLVVETDQNIWLCSSVCNYIFLSRPAIEWLNLPIWATQSFFPYQKVQFICLPPMSLFFFFLFFLFLLLAVNSWKHLVSRWRFSYWLECTDNQHEFDGLSYNDWFMWLVLKNKIPNNCYHIEDKTQYGLSTDAVNIAHNTIVHLISDKKVKCLKENTYFTLFVWVCFAFAWSH